jgi:UDP-glucose 4-epimerase
MWRQSCLPERARPLNILVTGGAGYIGSNTALALMDAGHNVIILDDFSSSDGLLVPPAARLVVGNAGDRDLVAGILARENIAAVMHFAASISVEESLHEPARYYRNNLATTIELADAAAAAGVRAFIFSSTAAVYGEGDGTPLSEACAPNPVNVYGRSKAMAETVLQDIAAATGLGVGILRYFNAAGADPSIRSGQATAHPHHLIEIATQVATGDRAMLSIFGSDYPTADGTAVRDYVHVRDIAEAHLLVMKATLEKGGNRVHNVGTGNGSSVQDVIDALAGVCGAPVPVTTAPRRAGDPAILVADSTRLRQELGWAPRYELEDMLRHALLWEQTRRRMASRTAAPKSASGASHMVDV